jgi:hypothetical protein
MIHSNLTTSITKLNDLNKLCVVAHTCNLSYLRGGRDQEDHHLRPNPDKKFMRPPLNQQKLGVAV